MKRFLMILVTIGLTSGMALTAAMSTSRVRKDTRFLTDKMAYELRLSPAQYDDVYEINYDFINSIRYMMDDVMYGEEWALNDYYRCLDIRNDDLRWVLNSSQYRRFLQTDYFFRPVYASGGRWYFRVYITYTNHNHFYFGRPRHYHSYCGGHHRTHYNNVSYYRGRYNHPFYTRAHSVRDNRVFHSHRRSDFGSVRLRPNTLQRPSHRPNKVQRPSHNKVERPSRVSGNHSSSSRPHSSASSRRESRRETTTTPPPKRTTTGSSRRQITTSSRSTRQSSSSSSSRANRRSSRTTDTSKSSESSRSTHPRR